MVDPSNFTHFNLMYIASVTGTQVRKWFVPPWACLWGGVQWISINLSQEPGILNCLLVPARIRSTCRTAPGAGISGARTPQRQHSAWKEGDLKERETTSDLGSKLRRSHKGEKEWIPTQSFMCSCNTESFSLLREPPPSWRHHPWWPLWCGEFHMKHQCHVSLPPRAFSFLPQVAFSKVPLEGESPGALQKVQGRCHMKKLCKEVRKMFALKETFSFTKFFF